MTAIITKKQKKNMQGFTNAVTDIPALISSLPDAAELNSYSK